jgi:hypothetical protein
MTRAKGKAKAKQPKQPTDQQQFDSLVNILKQKWGFTAQARRKYGDRWEISIGRDEAFFLMTHLYLIAPTFEAAIKYVSERTDKPGVATETVELPRPHVGMAPDESHQSFSVERMLECGYIWRKDDKENFYNWFTPDGKMVGALDYHIVPLANLP